MPIIRWEDFPYAMKAAAAPDSVVRRELDPTAAAAKLRAVQCYRSQLDFQFGSPEQATAALARWTCEGFCESTIETRMS